MTKSLILIRSSSGWFLIDGDERKPIQFSEALEYLRKGIEFYFTPLPL